MAFSAQSGGRPPIPSMAYQMSRESLRDQGWRPHILPSRQPAAGAWGYEAAGILRFIKWLKKRTSTATAVIGLGNHLVYIIRFFDRPLILYIQRPRRLRY